MLNPTKLLLIALIWFCKSTSLPKLYDYIHTRRSEKLGPELNVNGVAHPPPPYSQFNNDGFAAVQFNVGFRILIWLLVRLLVVHNLISGGFRGGGMHPPHQPKHNVHMRKFKHLKKNNQ